MSTHKLHSNQKPDESQNLLRRLRETGYTDWVEEEAYDPYRTSLVRLKAAGFDIF